MRGHSPMALRSQAGFSGTYNPQQWGPVIHPSPHSGGGEHRQATPSSRTASFAPRPVGPDGKPFDGIGDDNINEELYRACGIPSTPLLPPP